MTKKTILGMPSIFFYIICIILIIGIIIGSFYDFQISESLSKPTNIGEYFQRYGNMFSNCLYPIAGVCLFKGLKNKGKQYKPLAWGLLILSFFVTIQCDINVSGSNLRKEYGFVAGASGSFLPLILCLLTWLGMALVAAFITYILIDEKKSNQLIMIGAIILIAGVCSIKVNEWLKVLANRPRYKYLITLENPLSEFRNWWQMKPYISKENAFLSWPSGHMTYASITLCLPMLASVLKQKKEWIKYLLFSISIIWLIAFGYNRIHMNAHFLSDVCFGTLITYCIYAIFYKLAIIDKKPKNQKDGLSNHN